MCALVDIADNLTAEWDVDIKTTEGHAAVRAFIVSVFPEVWAEVSKAMAPLAKGLGTPAALEKQAMDCAQITLGVHVEFSDRSGIVEKINQSKFHQFSDLAPELRIMIWKHAVSAQDRIVDTNKLRRITRAPCPVLFLVCKEALRETKEFYQRISQGDILYGRVIPLITNQYAPVVSFEHDIWNIGDWDQWDSRPRLNPVTLDARRRRRDGQPLRSVQRRIEAVRDLRIRRIAVTILDTWVPDSPLIRHERLFYKNARWRWTCWDNNRNDRDDWGFAWTDFLREVWCDSVRGSSARYNRVFPPLPGHKCPCGVCVNFDNLGEQEAGYEKPAPLDREAHERIFDLIPGQLDYNERINERISQLTSASST